MLEEKNIQSKKYQLGQFFTPVDLVQELISELNIDSDIIIEPSFGDCGFIEPMIKKYGSNRIVGIELDKEWFDKGQNRFPKTKFYHSNFYDIDNELVFQTNKVSFIGNVPFRSPAYSLSTHKNYVKALSHKYGVSGIREEAVFFIIKTADIMIENQYQGEIHYIIPKSLITNDSKFFYKFKLFLKKYFTITSVVDIDPARFDNVSQGLIFLSMKSGGDASNYQIKHNGILELVDDILNLNSSDIPFQTIFKKTYLGSIPAESFLLSVSGESKEEFRDRLARLIITEHTVESLKLALQHNKKFHLKVLSNKDTDKIDFKINQILNYIASVKEVIKDLSIFSEIDNYFLINHRKETRFYFRHHLLKKCNFVYELNPNPCPSFFFTSNPVAGGTDYFGYCEFDITRNSSPGCCRTVPLNNISDNLTDEFKQYWNINTNSLPFELLFHYISHIYNSKWYKTQKGLRKRFYFCLPNMFDETWLHSLTQEKKDNELKILNGVLLKTNSWTPSINKPITNNFNDLFF